MRLLEAQVDGRLENTGRGIRFNVNHNSSGSQTIRAGPFAYEYRLDHLILHFGREDDRGSEHTINGQRFAGELQAFFYNSLLYENYTEAEHQPNGLAAIAVLLQLDRGNSAPNRSTLELSELLGQMEQIKHKGSRSNATCRLNLARLLPTSPFYLTYEGSLTEPPCSESTIWIVLNRPLRITSRQLHSLRHSVVIDGYGDNFRPSQALIGRCIRTNIVNQSTLAEQNAATLELAKQRVEQEAAITTITANEVLDSSATAKNASSSVAIGAVKSFCSNGNRIGFYAYKGESEIQTFQSIYFS